MKRLFQVVDTHTKKQHGTVFYDDKMAAKRARHTANEQVNDETRFIVSLGPDHRRFQNSK